MRFTRTEWALLLCSITVILVLSGCWNPFARGLVQPHDGDGTPGLHGIARVLAAVAIGTTWAAAIGLVGCAVACAWRPEKVFDFGKLALGCLAALVIAGLLHWVSAHWAVLMGLCAGVLVLSGIGWAYLHRKALEKEANFDLDQDGKIG